MKGKGGRKKRDQMKNKGDNSKKQARMAKSEILFFIQLSGAYKGFKRRGKPRREKPWRGGEMTYVGGRLKVPDRVTAESSHTTWEGVKKKTETISPPRKQTILNRRQPRGGED